jgi:hypothetical protein
MITLIISKNKETNFQYNPRLDNVNRDTLFKDKINRAEKFLSERGMLVTKENIKSNKKASV